MFNFEVRTTRFDPFLRENRAEGEESMRRFRWYYYKALKARLKVWMMGNFPPVDNPVISVSERAERMGEEGGGHIKRSESSEIGQDEVEVFELDHYSLLLRMDPKRVQKETKSWNTRRTERKRADHERKELFLSCPIIEKSNSIFQMAEPWIASLTFAWLVWISMPFLLAIHCNWGLCANIKGDQWPYLPPVEWLCANLTGSQSQFIIIGVLSFGLHQTLQHYLQYILTYIHT